MGHWLMTFRIIYSVELLSVITQGLRFVCVSNSNIASRLKLSTKTVICQVIILQSAFCYVSFIINHLEQQLFRFSFCSVKALCLSYLFNCMVALLYMPALGLQLPG
jgi:hypothetical protein